MNDIWALLAIFASTGGGIGRLSAPGTWGTVLLGLPCVLFLNRFFAWYSANNCTSLVMSLLLVGLINVCAVGVIHYALPYVQEQYATHDPQVIVLDEVVGLLFVFVGVPLTVKSIVAGTLLFRILDISKFGLIGWSEQFPGAWGIVIDDSIAGMVAGLLLRCILFFKK